MSNGSGGSGTTYTLIFQNNSSNAWDACVYQQDPNISNLNVMSLAWFAEAAAPTTNIQFQWQVNYSFVWSQTGTLAPGVIFTASQTWPANLSTTNQVTFTDAGGIFSFTGQTQGANGGTLTVAEDGTIPLNEASVGIGMSGYGTFVVPAEPNISVNFTPTPTYWITFGTFSQGQVLSIEEITSTSAQITFPSNVYSMTATLSSTNTWSVGTTAGANAAFVAAKRKNPKALWGRL